MSVYTTTNCTEPLTYIDFSQVTNLPPESTPVADKYIVIDSVAVTVSVLTRQKATVSAWRSILLPQGSKDTYSEESLGDPNAPTLDAAKCVPFDFSDTDLIALRWERLGQGTQGFATLFDRAIAYQQTEYDVHVKSQGPDNSESVKKLQDWVIRY
jgi:hypothetical protein